MEDNMINGRGGLNPYIRYVNAITDFDLNQLHVDQLLDTMNNNDYRLFQSSRKFSYLAVDSQKQRIVDGEEYKARMNGTTDISPSAHS